ncbi:MAG TPA: amino acid permease [Chthonomonadaceae bacterium]|nr:amino acid permease [Chthonomonadaceae bacterium]
MRSGPFARKPLALLQQEAGEEHRLRRVLGPASLTGLGVGGIIGTGIFVMIGMAAHDLAGPALTLSFVVAALACIAIALCYAEFAANVPVGGSAYSYAYATLGELPAWILGWNLVTCYLLGAASVAQGWSHYFQSFLGACHVALPAALTGVPWDVNPATGKLAATGALFDLPAALIIALMTAIIVRGIRASLKFNLTMLIVKLAVILFVIGVGAFYIHPQNWHPFAPFGFGGLSLFGKTWGQVAPGGQGLGMFAGAALVFYAYIGFDALSAYTEECQKPRRDVPIAILTSVGICAALYIAVAAVLTGMVRYDQINSHAPISEAFRQVGLPWAQSLVAVGALTGITSVLLVMLLSLPRILLAMGRDGVIPARFFNAVHPRYQTPWKGTLLAGGLIIPLTALLPLGVLFSLALMAVLFGYAVICASVLILRRVGTTREPAFRTPFGPLVPIFGVLTCLLLMASLPAENWLRLAVWLALGLAVYFLYSRQHSVLARRALDPTTITPLTHAVVASTASGATQESPLKE